MTQATCNLEPVVFPDPVISIAVKARDKAGAEKMGIALSQDDPKRTPLFTSKPTRSLAKPSRKAWANWAGISRSISSKRTHGVEVDVGKPQVAYRETITQTVEDTYTKNKLVVLANSLRSIASSSLAKEVGNGYEFESEVTGGNVPREFWPAIEKAFGVSMEEGTLSRLHY